MKVLTIKQPWAALIINGTKKYEFRSWKTSYRGKILIHAGLGVDKERSKDFSNLEMLKGAIIGEAEIKDCILVDEEFDESLRRDNEKVYGHDHVGLYAWKLDNIKRYDEPIYIKGKLGLWNYDK
jgi:hypothetical protein